MWSSVLCTVSSQVVKLIFGSLLCFLLSSAVSCSYLTHPAYFLPVLLLLLSTLLCHLFLSLHRLSPIWEVSEWALRAVPSERLCSLAQPRVPAVGWQPDRPLLAPVSRTNTVYAQTVVCKLAQGILHSITSHVCKATYLNYFKLNTSN